MKHRIRIILRAIIALGSTPIVIVAVPMYTFIEFLIDEYSNDFDNRPSVWLFYGWLNWITFGKYNRKTK